MNWVDDVKAHSQGNERMFQKQREGEYRNLLLTSGVGTASVSGKIVAVRL